MCVCVCVCYKIVKISKISKNCFYGKREIDKC